MFPKPKTSVATVRVERSVERGKTWRSRPCGWQSRVMLVRMWLVLEGFQQRKGTTNSRSSLWLVCGVCECMQNASVVGQTREASGSSVRSCLLAQVMVEKMEQGRPV